MAAQVTNERRLALGPQARGAVLDEGAVELRHPRGGRSRARAEGEDVNVGEPRIGDERQGVGEHFFVFRREAGDQVGAEGDVGAHGAHLVDEGQ